MLAKDTWKVLDYIINEPNPNRNLNFAINSNLGLDDKMIDKLIGKINKIEDEDRVNEFIIFKWSSLNFKMSIPKIINKWTLITLYFVVC